MIKKAIKAFVNNFGYDISRIDPYQKSQTPDSPEFLSLRDKYSSTLKKLGIMKAHYGCGPYLFGNNWVNIDRNPNRLDNIHLYMIANLAGKHPFPSNHFKFGFAEDFLEHLTQEESIIFLSEAFRCLQIGGVLRLSFPGLRGVLQKHYRSSDYEGASIGREEAFTSWEHKHFYCEESLSLVARHIGFSDIHSVQYGISAYEELSNIDSREEQQGLNVYAELIK